MSSTVPLLTTFFYYNLSFILPKSKQTNTVKVYYSLVPNHLLLAQGPAIAQTPNDDKMM